MLLFLNNQVLACVFLKRRRLFFLLIFPPFSALISAPSGLTLGAIPPSPAPAILPPSSVLSVSISAGCHPAFPSSYSAGCHPAFICSRSTLSCAREFRERVAIAFCPSLSCVRHLRWRVFLLPPVLFSSPNPSKSILYIYI